MVKRTRLFVVLSFAIALIDGVFVWVNNNFATVAFQESLELEGARLHASFDTLVDQTYANMLAMATFISNDREIQQLFLDGNKAVALEGGGKGGIETARVRRQLFDKVGPNWKEVQKKFQVRQLHFHLGPGSTSFLRIHRPDKFGDNMDDVRFTIVDTNKEKTARTGFETGRVYSGLRGVVPVSAWDVSQNNGIHVGALEVGTSFDVILKILDERYDLGVGVMLTRDHVNSAMWPDFIKKRFGGDDLGCDCVMEAATRRNFSDVISEGLQDDIHFREIGTELVHVAGHPYAVSHFPLRDYLGDRDSTREPVGSVVFWRDAGQQMEALEKTHFFNIIYGLAGYLLIELLLYAGFNYALRRLEHEVSERTEALHASKQALERKAVELAELADKELSLNKKLTYEVALKNRFFSIISHDLKGPFTSLLGMTQLMTEMAESFSREKLLQYAYDVNQSGKRIFDLLQNLLEWSRFQMEGGNSQPSLLALDDIVTECLALSAPEAKGKKVEIRKDVENSMVYCDRNVVQTVLRNLIANAIKFSPKGSTVQVISSRQDDKVRISIIDKGVGMSDDYLRRIFAVDQKTTTMGTEGEKGTGLGLPLCKELLDKNGGEIRVESEPGAGTAFHVLLPAQEPPGEGV